MRMGGRNGLTGKSRCANGLTVETTSWEGPLAATRRGQIVERW